MLPIDASNIGHGGGGTLLRNLVDNLADREHHVVASKKSRLPNSQNVTLCAGVNPLGTQRQTLLEKSAKECNAKGVLFFGNVPSKRKLEGLQSFTYFQNALLLKNLTNGFKLPPKDRIKFALLRRFIRRNIANTNHWIFQTAYIRNAFVSEYAINKSQSHVFPFVKYNQSHLSPARKATPSPMPSFVYLSDDYPHKNHSTLFDAWELLNKSYHKTPPLHVTVSKPSNIKRIKRLNLQGCDIINHGVVPHESALQILSNCTHTIFPSLLETIGLGLIEGAQMGLKVVCADIDGYREVIEPSDTFDARSAKSIADCVKRALETKFADAKVVLSNRVECFIDFIYRQI